MNFLQIFLILSELPDGGPIYAETNMSLRIVEPFNAVSSLAYLLPAVYWFVKLKGKYRNYAFLTTCMPFLILGGLGSTLYHAFRSSSLLLYMDVLPILILTLMVSIYFWIKILSRTWYIIFVLLLFFGLRYMVYVTLSTGNFNGQDIETQTAINISYAISGAMIFIPALMLMAREKLQGGLTLSYSCLLFMLGLFFREIDSWNLSFLSMGTHFLWHISTAAGSWFLGKYLYDFRKREMNRVNLTI